MSSDRPAELVELLEQAQLGWALRCSDATPRSEAERLLARVDEAAQAYEERFGARVDLLAACRAKPEEMRAFLQTLTAGVSAPFLAMVAGIVLRDARVAAVRFELVARASVSLSVELEEGGERRLFESNDLWDAQVLRHFGLMKAGNKPVIDGYYASRALS